MRRAAAGALVVALAGALACSGKQERRDGGAGRGDAGISTLGDGGGGDAGVAAVLEGDAAAVEPGDAAAAEARAGAAAGPAAALDAFGYTVDDAAAKAGGAVRVIVRWPDTPQARRASPGDNECQRSRLPSVVPDELWGIPDVVVALVLARGKAPAAAGAVTLAADTCAVGPRASVALPGASLVLANRDAAMHTAKLKSHPLRDGVASLGSLAGGTSHSARLPWRGHRVEVALAEPAVLQIELEGKHGAEDAAWLVVAPTPYAGVTDRAGAVLFGKVPAGEVEVKAWIPPRAGAKAVEMRGAVKVSEGQTAELVLTPAGKAAPAGNQNKKTEPAEGAKEAEGDEEAGS
jgi:hypothetical protein